MATLSNLFRSKYLKAEDLDRDRVVSIERVEMELVGRDKELKAIVYFVGGRKGLVLNKTNATSIATIAGSEDTDAWPGTRVMLFVAAVEFAGSLTNSIRVKAPPQPKPATPPPPSPPPAAVARGGEVDDDTIPF